jgi:hypothetical protein
MNDNKNILLGAGIVCVIFALLVGIVLLSKNAKDMFIAFSIVNILSIAFAALYLVQNTIKAKKTGVPTQDEMSKAMTNRAGYYSLNVSMIMAVTMMFINIAANETGSYYIQADTVLPLIVIVPGMMFVLLRQYFLSRGITE